MGRLAGFAQITRIQPCDSQVGTFAFQYLTSHVQYTLTFVLKGALGLAVAALALAGNLTGFEPKLLSLVLFQAACGVYLPATATLRSRLFPEKHRAALTNWIRVPLNLLVILLLLSATAFTTHQLLLACAMLALVSLLLHFRLTFVLAIFESSRTALPVKLPGQ
eukprot:m.612298 g.612298  ORF g.612298 m.612298 type:complete len:164 (-) comp58146_c0_seq26:123-614(-)